MTTFYPDPYPMDSAPAGDGWILALVEGELTETKPSPWRLATRCDGGWCDDESYLVKPVAWLPVPDPQPKSSGWRKAEGFIEISPGKLPEGSTMAGRRDVWVASVVLPDGTFDRTREPDIWPTREGAMRAAQDMAKLLGLPIREAAVASNVIPFPTGGES